MKTLLLRADANAQIGTGHLMRCLALAQAWQAEGGAVTFITACDSAGLQQRLSDEGFQTVLLKRVYPDPSDWDATSAVLAARPDAWVTLDGYHFDPAYQRRIKNAGHPLLVIDDMAHLDYYHADVVLNQNIHAEQLDYTHGPDTRLLLGTEYALLRREFWPWRGWQREISAVAHKILVTMGGGDAENVTLKVIQALQMLPLPGLEAVVVVGGGNPHYTALEAAVIATPWIRLARNIANMPELIAWADLAVSAGGSTCWELAFMGLPSLLVSLAENQRAVASGMTQAGAALNLGDHHELTSMRLAKTLTQELPRMTHRATLAQNGRGLVDGQGSRRVVDYMQKKLSLRLVQADDSYLIWEWANDVTTRAASFSPDLIPWVTHAAWFAERLADPHCKFYLAVDASEAPIGQIRYQIEGAAATVSVSVAPAYRGQGYGVGLIQVGTQKLFIDTPVATIHAYIKPENLASSDAFARAGFVKAGLTPFKGTNALHYVYQRKATP